MNDINFQILTNKKEDYLLLLQWLSQDEILQWYEGRDQNFNYETIKQKFKPSISETSDTYSFFIIYNDYKVGYIQYYVLNNIEKNNFKYNSKVFVIGIDFFIGIKQLHNKGIGTKILNKFINFLKIEIHPEIIIVDPLEDNLRAIHVYEKCKFNKKKLLVNYALHEQKLSNFWLMELKILYN